MIAPRSQPVVIASANGNRFKNGGDKTCVETAFMKIAKGEDVLDALIAGVNLVELDPEETSVGYGGLPNAEGIVQLDNQRMMIADCGLIGDSGLRDCRLFVDC